MKQPVFFLVLLTALLLNGCKDFVVKKITNDSVTVLAPTNNTVTTSNAITFWWETMDGADTYNIQVVKPTFAAAQVLVTDTNVTGTRFQMSLSPGVYQWRIKGVNGGGSSKYTVYNLTIDTTSNLSAQLVVPIGPLAGYVSGSNSITFSWNAISSADKYNLQVNSNPAIDVTITNTSFTSTFSPGTYSWKVRALNAFSVSQFNTGRSFKIDQTAPAPPNNLIITSAFSSNTKISDTLQWRRNATDISYDSLYIYDDVTLTTVNTATTMGAVKARISAFLNAPAQAQSAAYWWRVKSVDSVGNRSVFSATSAFTLTP